jgi:hypothetical protein
MSTGKPFQPGNKFGRGRPKGSPNKKSIILQQLLQENSGALLEKAVNLAKKGDRQMLRFLLGPLLQQQLKETKPDLGPLPLNTPEDLLNANEKVIQKVASGELTNDDAQQMDALLESRRRLFETNRLDQRLRAIEEQLNPDFKPDKAA